MIGKNNIFLDDIRKVPIEEFTSASEEQIDAAKKIVMKLRSKFSCGQIENPQLQTFWSNLEALALDRDTAEEIVDYTSK